MKAPVLFDLASKYFNRVFNAVDLVPPTRVAVVLLLRFHVQPQTGPGTA